jgi:hypothetical protein
MTPADLTSLTQRAWTVSYIFDANPPEGSPCNYYALKRNDVAMTLDPASGTYADDLATLLAEPVPPAAIPLQTRVATALQALQAQPTISGSDLASVISALTA